MKTKVLKYVAVIFLLNLSTILGETSSSQETTTVDSELLSTTPPESDAETTPPESVFETTPLESDAETTPLESDSVTTPQDYASSGTESDDSVATTTEDAVVSGTESTVQKMELATPNPNLKYFGTKIHPFPPFKYLPFDLDSRTEHARKLIWLGHFQYDWQDSRPDIAKEYFNGGQGAQAWVGGPFNIGLYENSTLSCRNSIRPDMDSPWSGDTHKYDYTGYYYAAYSNKTDYDCTASAGAVMTTPDPSTTSESPTTAEPEVTTEEVSTTTQSTGSAESTSPSDEEPTTRETGEDYSGIDLTSSEEARRLNRTAVPY